MDTNTSADIVHICSCACYINDRCSFSSSTL